MSMKLIDSNKLIDYFFYGIDDKSITGSTETDEKVIQVIQSQEAVKAIPIEKLEQIKAEIKHFMYEINPNSSESDYACNYVLEIIDKAIKEVSDDKRRSNRYF